jgi:hypothetical protein
MNSQMPDIPDRNSERPPLGARASVQARRSAGSRHAIRLPLLLATLVLAAATAIAGCGVLGDTPPDLDYFAGLTDDGVRVVLTVHGGPRPTAWVGFGLTSIAPDLASRRIVSVQARRSDGVALAVQPAGDSAYRIDVDRADPWVLEYVVALDDPPADFYHRSSTRSPQHLVLLGIDVLAQIYASPGALSVPAQQRRLSPVGEATVSFDVATVPPTWRVLSAEREIDFNLFRLASHPADSVFVLGPYQLEQVGHAGMRAAIHDDWPLDPSTILNTTTQLARVLVTKLGQPPGDPALLVFTPLPPAALPSGGARTAGMVWNRTLNLFSGLTPGLAPASREIREMTAIFVGHELFHLYVPWGVPITQELSWLSEGWAMHMGRTAAVEARLLGRVGNQRALRKAYDSYIAMGGHRAGNLGDAGLGGEEIRQLLYVRGELVFRIMSLEWQESGKPGHFDSVLWQRLLAAYDGENPLTPDIVASVLRSMVSPSTVRRYVEGTSSITLAELGLR